MMPKTFDCYRSLNNRLHATLDQEDNYEKYLKRIDEIVSKKPQLDMSSSFYMGFVNKCHQRSKHHRSQQKLSQISSENQILLQKIVNAKKKKMQKVQDKYMLAMHEKRFRDLQKINQENRQIAMRVIHQKTTIDNKRQSISSLKESKQSPRRIQDKTFYESRIKQRKLPKLMDMKL